MNCSTNSSFTAHALARFCAFSKRDRVGALPSSSAPARQLMHRIVLQLLRVVQIFPSGAQRHHPLPQQRRRLVPHLSLLAPVAQPTGHSFH